MFERSTGGSNNGKLLGTLEKKKDCNIYPAFIHACCLFIVCDLRYSFALILVLLLNICFTSVQEQS